MLMTNSFNDDKNLYELLNRLIHDLRSPLASLLMWNDFCKSLPPEEKHSVTRSIERIKETIDSTDSKLRKKPIAITSFNIDGVIHEMLMEKENEYRSQDIKIFYNEPDNYDEIYINGERGDFVRMLSNLMNNAKDALKGKPGVIRIGLHEINNVITLYINDDGCGMPEEVLQKLVNGEEITYGKENGHGIGMGQIRDTIAKLNGTLDIKSTVGQGSTFAITFDLKK